MIKPKKTLTESLKQSIFVRIYAGLLLVCLLVAVFANYLLNAINDKRIESYREDMATGMFYLIAQGYSDQYRSEDKKAWLADASILFGETLEVVPISRLSLSNTDLKRLQSGYAVVHYNEALMYASVYYLLTDKRMVLTARVRRVTEQQVRALAYFLQEDLSHYYGVRAKRKRLDYLQKKFVFPLELLSINEIELDDSQQKRLDRDEVVILFKDQANLQQNSFIKIIVPIDLYTEEMVLVVGPIKLFHWFPLNVVLIVVLLSMFLISFGVYALIWPLERSLRRVQLAIKALGQGKLNTKVDVVGQDEVAVLANTFNVMSEHIRRLIEAQRELTRAVSHELRTPVARIRFAVDMLADTDDIEERHQQREQIDADIEELNTLIDEILTYAKLEEGAPKLDWETIDLRDLVLQIVKETNALGKPIKVDSQLPNQKIMVTVDKRYLHRVLQNLAGNALRYANSTICISAGINKGEAFICVEDDGEGIAEEDRKKVFNPFTRLDDSRTRSSGGYGLGLSIVSRIAFWFNGQMQVDESPKLGGARFIMAWPTHPLSRTIEAEHFTQEQNERKVFDKKQGF